MGRRGPKPQGGSGPFFTDVFPGQKEEGGQGRMGYSQGRALAQIGRRAFQAGMQR